MSPALDRSTGTTLLEKKSAPSQASVGQRGLERLTEPSELVEADEGAAERGDGEVDVGAAFITHDQATQAGQPGIGALDYLAVAAEALAGMDAAPGDAGPDTALVAVPAAAPVVIGLVGVQLVRASSRAAALAGAHRWDRVHDKVALGAGLAAIRRVRAGRLAPFLAGTLALSSEARLQSNWSAPSSRSSKARCRAACCQSRSLRQQLIPDPHPISAGKYSHGKPVLSTNTMPVKAARSGTGGLPPFGLGRAGGNKGAITAQRSSGTSSLAMPLKRARSGLAVTMNFGISRISRAVVSRSCGM